MSENNDPVQEKNQGNTPEDGNQQRTETPSAPPAPAESAPAEVRRTPAAPAPEAQRAAEPARDSRHSEEPTTHVEYIPIPVQKTEGEQKEIVNPFSEDSEKASTETPKDDPNLGRIDRRVLNQRRKGNQQRNQPRPDNRQRQQQPQQNQMQNQNAEIKEKTEQPQVRQERPDRQQTPRPDRQPRAERIERVDRKDRNDRNQKSDPAGRVEQQTQQRIPQNEKISIVVPLFNEEQSLRPLYTEIRKVFENTRRTYEIVFVDDGSTDKSLMRIKEISRVDKRVKYISFQKNYGKSAALQMGFKMATGSVIITMDADLQDDPKEIPNLIKKLEEGWDLVSGWKKKRYDPFIKRFSSKFFNFTTRIFSGIKIHDFNCGLKAYRKAAAQSLQVYGELHRYMPVLAHWNGFSVTEIDVKHHPRMYGKTKFGISRFFKGFVDLLTVVFLTRYIKRPMHLFGFLGAFTMLAGLAVNGYLTWEWINGQPLSNRPMLFLGMLLIIVGTQFFSTGLLGELMVHNFQNDAEYKIKDQSN